MVDMLKITSPITPKDTGHNLQKQIPTEGVFDLTNTNVVIKMPPTIQTIQKNPFDHGAMSHLSKEVLGPLLESTDNLLESMRKIVVLVNTIEAESGNIPKEFLDKLFISADALLKTLLRRDKDETAFGGVFFDTLRLLSKLENQPKLQGAIALVLKYFDCYINRDNTLEAVVQQSRSLPGVLLKADRAVAEELGSKLELLVSSSKDDPSDNPKEVLKFLKNDYIPVLRKLVQKNDQDQIIRNTVMAIIHNIVRMDKANPKRLDEAITYLNEELKLLTNIPDKNLVELKSQLLEKAREVKTGEGDTDVPALISKVLDKSESTALHKAAQNLLSYMVQSESPVLPIMHFMLPIDFYGNKTYGEFFIDKNCEERKGDAKKAQNIFFTIQSDKIGTFEVDLLAKDQYVELNIKCPENLIESIKSIKTKIREKIEAQGYRMSGYQVSPWQEGQSILERFPKFALRKAGINVKV